MQFGYIIPSAMFVELFRGRLTRGPKMMALFALNILMYVVRLRWIQVLG